MTESDPLSESTARKLVLLLGMLAADGKSRPEQISMLSRAGLNSAEIGRVLDMSPGGVRSIASRARAKGKKEIDTTETP